MPELHRLEGRNLTIAAGTPQAKKILKALASEPRLRMLELLSDRLYNVSEIAEALELALSTANRDIGILEEAGLLRSELTPATRGLQKMCNRVYDTILIELPSSKKVVGDSTVEVSMPVGAYVDSQITPTCGLASETGIIGLFDDPSSFYEPDRLQAQLIWFHYGYVEYRFPNRLPPKTTPTVLRLSLELCSEAPMHHEDWPSDVTVWINGTEIGGWTSPSDFGGRRGVLTPDWWETRNTQHGLLKVWQVNRLGSFVDGIKISDIRLGSLAITEHQFISVRIGVKSDAQNIGGINIFGSRFGNYPQDIILRLDYQQS
jgi:predicted transcriptional regulator